MENRSTENLVHISTEQNGQENLHRQKQIFKNFSTIVEEQCALYTIYFKFYCIFDLRAIKFLDREHILIWVINETWLWVESTIIPKTNIIKNYKLKFGIEQARY